MITQSEYDVTKQSGEMDAKLYIMDFNYNILDEISGVVLTCSFNNDSKSALRRSCSISISPTDASFDISYGNKLWLDKYIKIYTGIKDVHTGEFAYTNRGIYLINNPSRVYSATDNTITIQGLDLMAKLTGERNGNLEGIPYIIPSNTFTYDAIIDILELGGFTQYTLDYNNCPYVPNEIKIDVGGTLYDLLKAILDIDEMMQMYFDVDGVFHYERIPLTSEEQIIINDDIWSNVLIDYRQDTNYSDVKNSIEVFGKTHDISHYDNSATMTGGGTVYGVDDWRQINVTLSGLSTNYPEGMIFGVVLTNTIPQRTTTYLVINSDTTPDTTIVRDAGDIYFEIGTLYVFKIQGDVYTDVKNAGIQYMGGIQPYAKVEETDSSSPFYINGTMGIVRKALSGGDYDNISTDLMASQRADWELYQRCRVQDNIILTCAPIYWADVNTLIEITLPNKDGIEETNRYMIKSISDAFGVDETQTINAMRYYPYYNTYEPDMDGVYDTINLFVAVEENTTESISLSANFDAYATIDWGDELNYPLSITSDVRYDRDYIYDDLSDDLIYTENGINYKGVWIKIKAPRTEMNYIDLSYQTQNITKFYANVDTLAHLNDVENLKEIKLVGDLTTYTVSGYSYVEDIYVELKNNTSILFPSCTSIKTAEIIAPSLTSADSMFNGCTSLESATLSKLDNVTTMQNTFKDCTSLTTISISGSSNVTDVYRMFYNCTSLVSPSLFDTSGVTSASNMFEGCTALKSLPLFNTSNATSTNNMFEGCTGLISSPKLIMSSVTTALYMFLGCTSLTTSINMDTSNVVYMDYMFSGCTSLETAKIDITSESAVDTVFFGCTSMKNLTINNPQFKGSIVDLVGSVSSTVEYINIPEMELIGDISGIFNGITTLNTVILNGTVNVTGADSAFSGCTSLVNVAIDDTSNITNMTSMFQNCTSLTTNPNINTSGATAMTDMFSGCTGLLSVVNLDISSILSDNMFSGCSSLATISLINGDSLVDISGMFYGLIALEDVSITGSPTITLARETFNGCSSLVSYTIPDISNAIQTYKMFYGCSSLTSITDIDTSSSQDMHEMFSGCSLLEEVYVDMSSVTSITEAVSLVDGCDALISLNMQNAYNITQFASIISDAYDTLETFIASGLTSLTDASAMTSLSAIKHVELYDMDAIVSANALFYESTTLESVKISSMDSSTGTVNMFRGCTSLISVDMPSMLVNIDASNMFLGCTSLTSSSIINLDTSNVQNISGMFADCILLDTIPLIDTSSATSMNNVFNNCESLIGVPLIDTSSVTTMNSMFAHCDLLTTVPLLVTTNAINMAFMFNECPSLTSVPLFDMSSNIDMGGMFLRCSSITTIPVFNTPNLTDMNFTFQESSIETVEISDATNVDYAPSMLLDANNLSSLILPNLYQVDLTLPNTNQMDATALNALFTSLGDCSSSPKTLTITGSLGAGSCDTSIAIAKGWIVVN